METKDPKEKSRFDPLDPTFPTNKPESYTYDCQYNIENWHTTLGGSTIDASFVPLSPIQARALVHTFRKQAEIQPSEKEALRQLKKEIQKSLEENYKDKPVFVRLSAISPKDAFIASEVLAREVKKETEKYKHLSEDDNKNALAWAEATISAYKLNSAEEVVNILASSSRVHMYLQLFLKFPTVADVNVVLRPWLPVEPRNEFRVFVYGGEVTAISQYHDTCLFSPRLNEAEVREAVREFFEKEVGKLEGPLANAVVDVALDVDKGEEKGTQSYVVDINPWRHATRAALFRWQKDMETLQDADEVTVRLVTPKNRRLQGSFTYLDQVARPGKKTNSAREEDEETFPWSTMLAVAVGVTMVGAIGYYLWSKRGEGGSS